MKELKAPDKVTQKMTHDGAVAENLSTGEVTNISSREAETDFSADREPLQTAQGKAGGQGGRGNGPGRIGGQRPPFFPAAIHGRGTGSPGFAESDPAL